MVVDSSAIEKMPEEKKEWLEDTVFMFGKFSAVTLSEWTHRQGSPWDTVVNEIGQLNDFIPDDLIKEYFQNNVVKQDDKK